MTTNPSNEARCGNRAENAGIAATDSLITVSRRVQITVRQWSEEEFASSAQQWDELLAQSQADALFMSWRWQMAWWRHHAEPLHAQLYILAGYCNGALIGIAPLYLRKAQHRHGIAANRIELMGSAWRTSDTVFSEYLDLIVRPEFATAFVASVGDALLDDTRWADLVISNTCQNSTAATLVRKRISEHCYVREADSLCAHISELPASFDEYLASLNAATRRKIWNTRRRLVEPRLVSAAPQDVNRVFQHMDAFHAQRWGKQHYVGVPRNFHLEFARQACEAGLLRMTELVTDSAVVSVMYNIRIGATEYNVQSAFDAASLPGLSPGYLHFGYALENACHDGMQRFDFLAGAGRSRNYKHDFLGSERNITTFQAVRTRPLAWLYRGYDRGFLPRLSAGVPCIPEFPDLGTLHRVAVDMEYVLLLI